VQVCCSIRCSIIFATSDKGKSHAQKARKSESRAAAKSKKAKKAINKKFDANARLHDTSYQHKLTQAAYNHMRVREELLWFQDRGIEPYCISCLKQNMDWCCGHFKTVGHQANLRYYRRNNFLQCNMRCNKSLSGNIEGTKQSVGYKAGLHQRFGVDGARMIIDYCEINTELITWYGPDLKAMRADCARESRRLDNLLNGEFYVQQNT
jgi:hypothetical protein